MLLTTRGRRRVRGYGGGFSAGGSGGTTADVDELLATAREQLSGVFREDLRGDTDYFREQYTSCTGFGHCKVVSAAAPDCGRSRPTYPSAGPSYLVVL